jgi:hypothetical protein
VDHWGRVYQVWQSCAVPVEKTEKRYEYSSRVAITSCVFRRGWTDLDTHGSTFWNDTYNYNTPDDHRNLYYRYALNLAEAVKFVILHELAHVSGLSDANADTYARQMILEMRKEDHGLRPAYRSPGAPGRDFSGTRLQACTMDGESPPMSAVPPGSATQ